MEWDGMAEPNKSFAAGVTGYVDVVHDGRSSRPAGSIS